MADTFTLIPQDERGKQIVARFARQTGLDARSDDDREVFDLEDDEDHEIPFVETLDEIDRDWTAHVTIAEPS